MLGPVPFLCGSDNPLRKRGVLPEHAKTPPQGTRPDCFLLHGGLYFCRQRVENTNRPFPADKSYSALIQGQDAKPALMCKSGNKLKTQELYDCNLRNTFANL